MPVFIKGAAGAPKNEFGNKLLYGVGNIFTDESLVVTHDEGDEIWTKTGGEQARGCIDDDGNIVFTSQASAGSAITKIDPDGNVIWTNNEVIYPTDLDIDEAGNIYVTHLTTGANNAVSFRKIDKSGNEIWRKVLSNLSHYCNAVACRDNCIYIGTSAAIGYKSLIKYDSSGNEIWSITNRYGFNDIDTDSDGGVYAASPSNATNKTFCKYDKDGNEVFLLGRANTAQRVKCSKDSVFVSYNPNTTESFAKHQHDGTFVWKNLESAIPNVRGIEVDENGNVYIVCYSNGSNNPVIRKYNSSGNLLWSSALSGTVFYYGRDILLDRKGIAYCLGGSDLVGTNVIKKMYLSKEYRLEREIL